MMKLGQSEEALFLAEDEVPTSVPSSAVVTPRIPLSSMLSPLLPPPSPPSLASLSWKSLPPPPAWSVEDGDSQLPRYKAETEFGQTRECKDTAADDSDLDIDWGVPPGLGFEKFQPPVPPPSAPPVLSSPRRSAPHGHVYCPNQVCTADGSQGLVDSGSRSPVSLGGKQISCDKAVTPPQRKVLHHEVLPAQTLTLQNVQPQPQALQRELHPQEALLSLGSALHAAGTCTPCAWFWKSQSCQNGLKCARCHLCPKGEVRLRKKVKVAALQAQAIAKVPLDEEGSLILD